MFFKKWFLETAGFFDAPLLGEDHKDVQDLIVKFSERNPLAQIRLPMQKQTGTEGEYELNGAEIKALLREFKASVVDRVNALKAVGKTDEIRELYTMLAKYNRALNTFVTDDSVDGKTFRVLSRPTKSKREALGASHPEIQDFIIKFSPHNRLAYLSWPAGSQIVAGKYSMSGAAIKERIRKYFQDLNTNQSAVTPDVAAAKKQELAKYNADLRKFMNDPSVDNNTYLFHTSDPAFGGGMLESRKPIRSPAS